MLAQPDQITLQATRLPYDAQVPRSSSALAYISDSLYMFGGFSLRYHNDTYQADLKATVPQWLPRQRQYVEPSIRRGHTLTQFTTTKFLLFGGDAQNKYVNDLWMYTGTWYKLSCSTPDVPLGRYGHAAVVLGGYLYIFGGKNPHEQLLFDDLWRFDLQTRQWERLPGVGPAGRYGCSLSKVSEDKALLFGGSTGTGRVNDVWELTSDGRWISKIENNTLQVEPRTEHGACALCEGFLAVFCGFGEQSAFSDCWIIDIEGKVAKRVEIPENDFPSARHAFAYFSRIELTSVGIASSFVDQLGAQTIAFNQIQVDEPYQVAMVSAYVFGGTDGAGKKLGDLYKLDFCVLTRASKDQVNEYLKQQANINVMQMTMQQLQMQTHKLGGDSANTDDFNEALEEFETAVLDACQQLNRRVSATEQAYQDLNRTHRQQAQQFEQLGDALVEYIAQQKSADMMIKIGQLEEQNQSLTARLERLEQCILSSQALDMAEKQDYVQLQMGVVQEQQQHQPEEAKPADYSIDKELEQRREEVDQECIKNSVVQIKPEDLVDPDFEALQQDICRLKCEAGLDLDYIDEEIGKLSASMK